MGKMHHLAASYRISSSPSSYFSRDMSFCPLLSRAPLRAEIESNDLQHHCLLKNRRGRVSGYCEQGMGTLYAAVYNIWGGGRRVVCE